MRSLMIKNKKGGVDNFKGLMFGFILVTLFTFLFLSSIVDVANSNGVDTTEFSEGAFSLDPYENVLNDVEEDAENFRERFEKGSIWSIIAGIVVEGIFGIAKDMVTMIISPFTLLAQILNNVLNVPPVVTGVVLGLIILSTIFGIWSLIKKGD